MSITLNKNTSPAEAFNPAHTQYKQLQQRANAQLTGTTFDAKHLDKFLQTQYGDKGAYPIPLSPLADPKTAAAGAVGKLSVDSVQKMIPLQTNVRPDPCFLTVPRHMRKEINHGITSKPMDFVCQKRPQIGVGMAAGSGSPLKEVYQKEVQDLEKLKKSFDPKRLTLDQESRGLQKPKDRLREIEETKKAVQAYAEFKQAHALASKRDKLVKAGWKNGITGVDSVMDPETFFFKEKQQEMVERELQRIEMNERNREGLVFVGVNFSEEKE